MSAMSVHAGQPAVLPPVQLFCFAHAGGAASLYRRWPQALPRGVELIALELPGHGLRRALPVLSDWPGLLDVLGAELLARRDRSRPYALFGHSMGSLVAHELIHALRERGAELPVWLGASASVAPSRRKHETHWLGCSHEQMVDKLRALGGTPEALLRDRDFIELLLPSLRADFHLCGIYPAAFPADAGRAPLDCPVTVFTGRDDSATADLDNVARWRDTTRGECGFHAFAGGHFYLEAELPALLERVAESLGRALARPAAPAALPTEAGWTQ